MSTIIPFHRRYSLNISFQGEDKVAKFQLFPVSDEALLFHNLIGNVQPNIYMEQININLLNIKGLITTNNNK